MTFGGILHYGSLRAGASLSSMSPYELILEIFGVLQFQEKVWWDSNSHCSLFSVMCFITGRHIVLSRLSSGLGYVEWTLGFGVESCGNSEFNGGMFEWGKDCKNKWWCAINVANWVFGWNKEYRTWKDHFFKEMLMDKLFFCTLYGAPLKGLLRGSFTWHSMGTVKPCCSEYLFFILFYFFLSFLSWRTPYSPLCKLSLSPSYSTFCVRKHSHACLPHSLSCATPLN